MNALRFNLSEPRAAYKRRSQAAAACDAARVTTATIARAGAGRLTGTAAWVGAAGVLRSLGEV
jgi:hypothetical protein